MKLSNFLYDLLYDGKVTVDGQLANFDKDDMQQTEKILHEFYIEDILHTPLSAPAFLPWAVAWAANYFYTAVQLTVLRELDDEEVNRSLPAFAGEITAEAIYSADIILRQLPELFRLVKGLAPGDILVRKLQETAVAWPYSSVGMQLDAQPDETAIFGNASLRITYIDRIIQNKDKYRVSQQVFEFIKAASGDFTFILWPELEDYTLNKNEWTLTTAEPQ